ncbi:reverse transcriptase-like protein, partial [Streptomyces sp. NPDC013187]|uniref:reverse transcriptase-like protein n=1 Tax=Streptomyces sp. NPDC013187 TaxID=3364865 RepID=UPI0036766F43
MREFIVEADGGSRGNPGPAGYGAVVSDAASGETLRETAEYIGVATNNVAEYRGLLAGLRAAHALDPDATVHVRMDSKLVIEQMSGRWKIKHPDMKPLAAQAARVFPPGRVTYEWMPRAENKHADRLANEAMDAGARGERWSQADSAAELDAAAEGTGRAEAVAPSGPPGDAAAGAARVRGALAEGRASATAADSGMDAARGSTHPGRGAPAEAGAGRLGPRRTPAVPPPGPARSGATTDDADARAAGAVAEGRATADAGGGARAAKVGADTRGTADAGGGARAAKVGADTRGTADAGGGARAAKV